MEKFGFESNDKLSDPIIISKMPAPIANGAKSILQITNWEKLAEASKVYGVPQIYLFLRLQQPFRDKGCMNFFLLQINYFFIS